MILRQIDTDTKFRRPYSYNNFYMDVPVLPFSVSCVVICTYTNMGLLDSNCSLNIIEWLKFTMQGSWYISDSGSPARRILFEKESDAIILSLAYE